MATSDSLIQVRNLKKHYHRGRDQGSGWCDS